MTVSFSYRRNGRLRRVERVLYPAAGTFHGSIALPASRRRAPSLSLLVAGSTATQRVTARAASRR